MATEKIFVGINNDTKGGKLCQKKLEYLKLTQ
jgi:hypothetical protein